MYISAIFEVFRTWSPQESGRTQEPRTVLRCACKTLKRKDAGNMTCGSRTSNIFFGAHLSNMPTMSYTEHMESRTWQMRHSRSHPVVCTSHHHAHASPLLPVRL